MLKARFGISAKRTSILLGIVGTCLAISAYYAFGGDWFALIAALGALTVVQLFMPYIIHRKSTIGIRFSLICAQ